MSYILSLPAIQVCMSIMSVLVKLSTQIFGLDPEDGSVSYIGYIKFRLKRTSQWVIYWIYLQYRYTFPECLRSCQTVHTDLWVRLGGRFCGVERLPAESEMLWDGGRLQGSSLYPEDHCALSTSTAFAPSSLLIRYTLYWKKWERMSNPTATCL